MLEWLIPALCGVVVVAVLVKAFWNPPRPDPFKSTDTRLPPGSGPA